MRKRITPDQYSILENAESLSQQCSWMKAQMEEKDAQFRCLQQQIFNLHESSLHKAEDELQELKVEMNQVQGQLCDVKLYSQHLEATVKCLKQFIPQNADLPRWIILDV